jgi:hypothetical protein
MIRRFPLVCMLGLLAALASTGPSFAQGADDEQLFTRLSDKTFEKILNKEKIAFEKKSIKDGTRDVTLYSIHVGTYKAAILNYGGSLMFMTSFKARDNKDVSLERANEWNLKKRFSRAFVDRDGFGVLQLDLDFYGGTNERIIRAWIGMCKLSINDFATFVL